MNTSLEYDKQKKLGDAARKRLKGSKPKTLIVKVQLQAYPKPLAGHHALVYAKGHRYEHFQPVTQELIKAMPGDESWPRKAYFYARITENSEEVLCEVLLGRPAPWQEW